MASRAIWNGGWRVFADKPFIDLVHQLVHKRYGRLSAGQNAISQILSHPYVITDRRAIAEQQERSKRLSTPRTLLHSLMAALDADAVTWQGLEGATGQAKLTSKKISSRAVEIIDVSNAVLLVRLERHPNGGNGIVREQFWLWDSGAREARLLEHRATWLYPRKPEFIVSGSAGEWSPPDKTLEAGFYRLVIEVLDFGASERLRQAVASERNELLSAVPPEVSAEIHRLTGIDFAQEELERQRAIASRLNLTVGPSHLPSGLALGGRIRLQVTVTEPMDGTPEWPEDSH